MAEDLNDFYLKNNRTRSFPHPHLFPMLEKLIETTYFPISIYLFIIFAEAIQIMVLLWTYIDPNNLLFTNNIYPSPFSEHFSSLGINQIIKQYLTPYLTSITLFIKENISLRSYFIFNCSHFAFELFFLIIFLLLLKERIRESFAGKVLFKIMQYRFLLSLHCLLIYEVASVLIVFKCQSAVNPLLNDIPCFSGYETILSYIFNSITLVIKVFWLGIFSLFYQDFTIFSSKLPWSCPYNHIMCIQTLFKVLLVIAVLFINPLELEVTFKAIGILLYMMMIIYNRVKCPFYFNQLVTYIKIYLEGLIIFFTLLTFGYSVLALHFFSNVSSVDYYYLVGISLFLGGVYVYYIMYYSDQNLLSFFKEMITKNHNVDMYSLYINLHKMHIMIMESKTKVAFIHKLFMVYSCHFEYCNDERCFCHEVDFMLKNKEVQFQLNQFNETNLIYVNRRDFISTTHMTMESDSSNNGNAQGNGQGKDTRKLFSNVEEENRQLTTEDDAKAKFIEVAAVHPNSTNNAVNLGKNDNNKRSNDRVFWGKFISKLIYGYLSYKQTNGNKANKGKKRYFLSVIPLEEHYFELVKIEYANLIMFYLNNPINALIECNLIRFTASSPVSQFVVYLSMKRIFDETYKSKAKGINGVEMKNILLYNHLWTHLLFKLNDNIGNVQHLWWNLSKRLFNIRQLEMNCSKINQKTGEITMMFKDIMMINGHSTSSLDFDYKIFKIFGYYLKKIWKNDDNTDGYIKKAIDEISANSQMMNVKFAKMDENSGKDSNYINNAFFRLNRTGVVIINGDMTLDSFSRITYINDCLWQNIAGYRAKEEMLNKNINILMPDFIGITHDNYIKNYFLTSQVKVLDVFRSIFIINKEKLFVPVKLIIKLFPSLNRGINFVGYMTQSHFYEGMTSKANKVGYFLTDIKNKILFFDETVKEKLNLPNSITYNITKSPEDDFYLHSIFPELLNESKLEELKRGAYRLIFNEFGLEKYLENNREEDLPPSAFGGGGATFFSFHNQVSSDFSMYSLERKAKQFFKIGLVDKKYMNFDTKYEHEIVSFNKTFNIYYIIFERDPSDKVATILEELKCVEMYKNQKDEDDDIGSVTSSMSYNKGGGSTSINYMLLTIKTTLSSHKRPMILNIVGSLIILLLVIIISINLGEGAFLLMKVHEIQTFISFTYLFYLENYLFYSIERKMLMWHYARLGFIHTPSKAENYAKEIQDMITQLSYVQSNLTTMTSHSCLSVQFNTYVKTLVVPYRTYLSDKEFLETKKTLINFELDFVQSVKNILKMTDRSPSETITNFLIDYDGKPGYDFSNKDPSHTEFIINMLSYRYNYEHNYLNFYLTAFAEIIPSEKNVILSIDSFTLWIMIGVIVFLSLFYIGVSIMFYVLTLRIYSIMMLLANIPYHYIETCLNDIAFLQRHFEQIIDDDEFFVNDNLHTLRNYYLGNNDKEKGKKTNGDNVSISKRNRDRERERERERDKERTEAKSNVPVVTDTNRSSERKMLTMQQSINVLKKHPSIKSKYNQHDNNNPTSGPESKNDEKFFKYDDYYQKKQYAHIKYSTLKTSLSISFGFFLLLLGLLYVGSYFCIEEKVTWLVNDLEILDSLNQIRFNLPTMLTQNKLRTIDNKFGYSIKFSDYILYNQTYFNKITVDHRNNSEFQSKVMDYYHQINSYDAQVFCKVWVETNDLRFTEAEFNGNRNIDDCLTNAYFSNGIELGAIRASGTLQQLNSEWNMLPLTELQKDAKRLEIIKHPIINEIDMSVTTVFIPLIDNLVKLLCEYHESAAQKFLNLTVERFVIMLAASAIVAVYYFTTIQRNYFSHFENNKVLLLLVPLEYLRKHKTELKNYI